MAGIVPMCDSDEEVFFGPITAYEIESDWRRLMAEKKKKRELQLDELNKFKSSCGSSEQLVPVRGIEANEKVELHSDQSNSPKLSNATKPVIDESVRPGSLCEDRSIAFIDDDSLIEVGDDGVGILPEPPSAVSFSSVENNLSFKSICTEQHGSIRNETDINSKDEDKSLISVKGENQYEVYIPVTPSSEKFLSSTVSSQFTNREQSLNECTFSDKSIFSIKGEHHYEVYIPLSSHQDENVETAIHNDSTDFAGIDLFDSVSVNSLLSNATAIKVDDSVMESPDIDSASANFLLANATAIKVDDSVTEGPDIDSAIKVEDSVIGGGGTDSACHEVVEAYKLSQTESSVSKPSEVSFNEINNSVIYTTDAKVIPGNSVVTNADNLSKDKKTLSTNDQVLYSGSPCNAFEPKVVVNDSFLVPQGAIMDKISMKENLILPGNNSVLITDSGMSDKIASITQVTGDESLLERLNNPTVCLTVENPKDLTLNYVSDESGKNIFGEPNSVKIVNAENSDLKSVILGDPEIKENMPPICKSDSALKENAHCENLLIPPKNIFESSVVGQRLNISLSENGESPVANSKRESNFYSNLKDDSFCLNISKTRYMFSSDNECSFLSTTDVITEPVLSSKNSATNICGSGVPNGSFSTKDHISPNNANVSSTAEHEVLFPGPANRMETDESSSIQPPEERRFSCSESCAAIEEAMEAVSSTTYNHRAENKGSDLDLSDLTRATEDITTGNKETEDKDDDSSEKSFVSLPSEESNEGKRQLDGDFHPPDKKLCLKSTPYKNKENHDPKSRLPILGTSRLPVLKPPTLKVDNIVKGTVWSSDFCKKKIPQPRKPDYVVSPSKLDRLLKATTVSKIARPQTADGMTGKSPLVLQLPNSRVFNTPQNRMTPNAKSQSVTTKKTPGSVKPNIPVLSRNKEVAGGLRTPPKNPRFKGIASPVAEYIKNPSVLIRNVTTHTLNGIQNEKPVEVPQVSSKPGVSLTPKYYSSADKCLVKPPVQKTPALPKLGERQAKVLVTPKPQVLQHLGRTKGDSPKSDILDAPKTVRKTSHCNTSYAALPQTFNRELDVSVIQKQ